MTSYKQIALDMEEKLSVALHENATLQSMLELARGGLVEEMMGHMATEDAKEALRVFADRAQTREELVLLIRALSNLK